MFLMYPVLKLEICPVACKRKQIIFKRKKKPKYFWCHYSILSIHGEMQKRTAHLQVSARNSTEKKQNEDILLDPKVRSLDQP